MLTTTMELWPYGDQFSAKKLITINIANVGPNASNPSTTDYVWTVDEPSPLFGNPIHSEGVLLAYNRRASAVAILAAVLDAYENPHGCMSKHDEETAQLMRNKTIKNP